MIVELLNEILNNVISLPSKLTVFLTPQIILSICISVLMIIITVKITNHLNEPRKTESSECDTAINEPDDNVGENAQLENAEAQISSFSQEPGLEEPKADFAEQKEISNEKTEENALAPEKVMCLAKYRSLLDAGLISENEYKAHSKELLNL